MSSLIQRDKVEAKKKLMIAGAAWGGTVLLATAGMPIVAVGAATAASYLTYRWFVFRAKRGMRF